MIAHRADVEWCSKNAELDVNVFRSAHSWAGEIVLLRVMLLNTQTKNKQKRILFDCVVGVVFYQHVLYAFIQLKYNANTTTIQLKYI